MNFNIGSKLIFTQLLKGQNPIFSALIFSSCSEEEKNNSSDNTVMPWDFKLRQECADKGSYWVNGICQEDAFDWSNETCYIDGSSYSGIICKEVESCYDYEDEWNHDTKTCIKALRVTSLNNSTPKFPDLIKIKLLIRIPSRRIV